MKKNLIFATNNRHKIEEVSAILDGVCNISGLKEIGCFEDIPEEMDTIRGNAMQKARFIFEKYGFNCFADDTGLFVDSLDGEPGVYSARYAGEECDSQKNIDKLLDKLKDKTGRKALFKTVVALIIDGNEYKADILKTAEAEQKFEEATESGRTAGILETRDSELFSYSLNFKSNQRE